ncbi:hypothetical protein ACOTSX_04665 [Bacillus velezensis]|uniref:hypothetical protein n=1 Tax=Bacillus velezensis TaxID=492670 RepID=UPI003369C360
MNFLTAKNEYGETVYFKTLNRRPRLGDFVKPIDTRPVDIDGNRIKESGNSANKYDDLDINSFYEVYRILNVKHVIIKDKLGHKVQLDSSQYQLAKKITKEEYTNFNEKLHLLKHIDNNLKRISNFSS